MMIKKKYLKVGFWKEGPGGYEEDVKFLRGDLTFKEKEAVLAYIAASTKHAQYKGWASCRECKMRLGDSDMLTPDKKYLFPERYEHYICDHRVLPPEGFRRSAMKWYKKKTRAKVRHVLGAEVTEIITPWLKGKQQQPAVEFVNGNLVKHKDGTILLEMLLYIPAESAKDLVGKEIEMRFRIYKHKTGEFREGKRHA